MEETYSIHQQKCVLDFIRLYHIHRKKENNHQKDTFEFGTIRSLSGTEIYKLKLKTRKKLGIYQFQDTLFEYTPL